MIGELLLSDAGKLLAGLLLPLLGTTLGAGTVFFLKRELRPAVQKTLLGFAAGVIGIGITLLLIIPINAIVQNLTGIESLRAILPVQGGVALVLISMILTFIAGLIPSGFAARRDPVEALRTE